MEGADVADGDLTDLYTQLHALLDRIDTVDTNPATEHDLVKAAIEHERAARRMASSGHRRVMDVSDRSAFRTVGCKSLSDFMSDKLRVTDVKRRMRAMDKLSRKYSMTGELMEPDCPNLAEALHEGSIGPDHLAAALDVMRRIPAAVSVDDRARAEASLAKSARRLPPRQITQVGARILAYLDPDGTLTNERDRARQRRLSMSDQDTQAMSKLTALLDPTTRAMFDVVLAAWGAAGMNNPDDEQSPKGHKDSVDSEVLKEAARRDLRSPEQRNHDAFKALCASALDTGAVGSSHRGLPPHVIVKITVGELREMAGFGRTTTGADLPIPELIELAARSQMYLAVFDEHTAQPLYLGRAKRLANESQRFMLFAQYGGCSKPCCTRPFSHVEIHHAEQDWADGGLTDVDKLAPACGPDNRVVGNRPGQYTTEKITRGPDAGLYGWRRNGDGTGPPDTLTTNIIHRIDEIMARIDMPPAENQSDDDGWFDDGCFDDGCFDEDWLRDDQIEDDEWIVECLAKRDPMAAAPPAFAPDAA